ncbi:MAG: hypothetical protein C1943_14250 [Halochromatium sp.]|nr:hypothetical protein [Halochromatium sp.]
MGLDSPPVDGRWKLRVTGSPPCASNGFVGLAVEAIILQADLNAFHLRHQRHWHAQIAGARSARLAMQ